MPSNTDSRPDSVAPGEGYETRDANARGIFRFLVGLAVVLLVSGIICWLLFRYLVAQHTRETNPSPYSETRQLPSGPNLQVSPREDWQTFSRRQQESLTSFGWENRDAGLVRVPIDRAMEILVEKGVPVAPPVPVEADAGASAPARAVPGEPRR